MEVVDTTLVDLLPGEKLLWQDRPIRHRLFYAPDAVLVPFTVVWALFAGFAFGSMLTSDRPPPMPFPVVLVPFAVVGLYLLVGRFVVRAIASRRIRYALTDRRLVVFGGVTGTNATSTYVTTLQPPVIAEREDRSGSLAFGAFPGVWDAFNSKNLHLIWASQPTSKPVLWDIPDVRRVRDLLAGIQAGSRT
jgi:hypothetical protein